ncbi:MAG: hypothetical protein R3F34_12995 [Planctomycetota bacterium]
MSDRTPRAARAALPAFAATLLVASHSTARADQTLFLGPEGGVGTVVVADETGLVPPVPVAGLDGIELLPVEPIGRTKLELLLPGRARLRTDVPGASRVELPDDAGSLYHFRRPGTAGDDFGFFVVDGDGRATLVVERAGTGALGIDDPFRTSVGVDATGSGVLVATTLAAGGDVLELDLVNGTAIDRTANLPPLDVLPSGLGLRHDFGVAIATDRLVRFLRLPGEVASVVPLPGAPAWFGGEIVFSENELVAATIAGASPNLAHPYALSFVGPAVRLDDVPAHLSPAGFLPGSVDGPYLALSGDGSVCVWRTEGVARDAWSSNVALVPPPPEPVTSDAQFVDTLDEVGLVGALLPFSGRAIALAVGEVADPIAGGIEGLDFYLVESPLGGGPPVITNLTRTSGTTAAPFDGGNIDPSKGAWLVPGAPRVLVRDDAGSGSRLSLLDLATATVSPLDANVDDVVGIERVGQRFLVSVVDGNKRRLVVADAASGTSKTLATLGSGAVYDRFAVRDDGWVGLGISVGALEWIARVDVVNEVGELLLPFPLDIGPALGWTPGGRLAISGGIAGTDPIFAGWGTGTTGYLVPFVPQPGFVLPGGDGGPVGRLFRRVSPRVRAFRLDLVLRRCR